MRSARNLSLEDRKTFDALKEQIEVGTFRAPRDSPLWLCADELGLTIAHYAASKGLLPDGFTGWDLRADYGCSVAECAMRAKTLPPGFDRWDIFVYKWESRSPLSIAHVAAKEGLLPKTFSDWDIPTVHLEDPSKMKTVAHIAAINGRLPKDFDQWSLIDGMGRTVAHEAAFRGCLPEGFREWDLLDANRMMVAELAFSHPRKGLLYRAAFEASRVSSEIEGHQVKAFIRRGGV